METILIVDDDSAVLGLVKGMLETEGYRVYAAESAAEAIAIAHELKSGFDLLLTDMVMPVTGGHDLIQAIRRLYPNARTIAMSGALPTDDIKERDYSILPKPFTQEQLLASLEAAFTDARAGQQAATFKTRGC